MKDDLDKQMVVMSDEAKREKAMEFERKVNEMQPSCCNLETSSVTPSPASIRPETNASQGWTRSGST